MGVRIEGRVMVHRTDIAGGSADRQVLAVSACAAAHLNGYLLEDEPSLKTLHFPRLFTSKTFYAPAKATRSAAATRRQLDPTMPTISNS